MWLATYCRLYARMAELEDALVLGTSTLCVWVRAPL